MSTSFDRTATAVTAIQNLETVEEIRDVIEAIKRQQTYLSRQNIRKIVKGSVVSFTARNGVRVVGVVGKVNTKTVVVKVGDVNGLFTTQYRVPASMLTVEEYAPSAEAVAV
jgi:hypothetical protein